MSEVAQGAIKEISTVDGTVDAFPYKVWVTNGSLTDNGDGTVTLVVGGSSSGIVYIGTGTDTYFKMNGTTLELWFRDQLAETWTSVNSGELMGVLGLTYP